MNNTEGRSLKTGNGTRRKSLPTSETKYPDGYVLPERDIHALVAKTRYDQTDAFAARMQVVVDATAKPVDGKLADADLQQLKQVASESQRPGYQRLMQALLAAVEDGLEGIEAACQTAACMVELYFLFTREHYFGLKMYEIRLRKSRQAADRSK